MLFTQLFAMAALAAAMPTELVKRTDGTANISKFKGASCTDPGQTQNLDYGKEYDQPADHGVKSVQYNAKHTGDPVKSVQVCVQTGGDSTWQCKSAGPSEPFCFTPGGTIVEIKVVGIKTG